MRILLIYPFFIDERGEDDDVKPIPIGLYYLGALLREEGHHVEIVNWYKGDVGEEEIAAYLRKESPDIVGISIFNANRLGGMEVARIAKEVLPGVRVVAGGVGATFLWRHLLERYPFLDFVVIGEGEITFLEVVEAISDGKGEDALLAIPGLALKVAGSPQRTGERAFIADLDSLPDPARYFTFQHVISSRGCPWACTFCGSPKFWKRKVRFHSARYFVGQLAALAAKGVSFFYVSDDTFTLDKKRVIEICKGIIDHGLDIRWQAISRVNCVDEEILYWMRLAGCVQISYGVESGSEKMRRFFNKKITAHEIERAFELTRSMGILPRAYFIYGSPGETSKTVRESVKLIHKIRPLAMVSYILDVYPGTKLYDDLKKKLKFSDDIWLNPVEDIMYFQFDQSLEQERVLSWGRRLRGEFYSNVHRYALDLELNEREELRPYHADFLARLGMTFLYGDYARRREVVDPLGTAERLFRRALEYAPAHDAYFGLGVIMQKREEFQESVPVLQEGVERFPGSEELWICLGLSLLASGRGGEAADCFRRFPDSPRARKYLSMC